MDFFPYHIEKEFANTWLPSKEYKPEDFVPLNEETSVSPRDLGIHRWFAIYAAPISDENISEKPILFM